MSEDEPLAAARWISRGGLAALIEALRRRGYRTVGPTARDGAIVYDEIDSAQDLPAGWTDEQDGGKYRLIRRDDEALFGHVVGPHSWKRFLFPPELRLWRAQASAGGKRVEFRAEPEDPVRYAFIGVRSCDLHAIGVQDRVFVSGDAADPHYRSAREKAFVVAVHCGQAGGTCFCVSMGTGPRATSGYDLALTEVIDDGRHGFVVEAGSGRGEDVLAEVPGREATDEETGAASRAVERAAADMGRRMDTTDIQRLLYDSYEHPRWDEVAERCLSCGNCTLVCPTCFCSSVEHSTDLAGTTSQAVRRWESCFSVDFSYVHGGSLRTTTKARYRQWITHKLATWIDQFGTSGCVGCGRCVTWCPVGIDITEEIRRLREETGRG